MSLKPISIGLLCAAAVFQTPSAARAIGFQVYPLAYSKVTFTSQPSGANLFVQVNGAWVSYDTTPKTLSLPAGDYDVKFTLPGYGDCHKTATSGNEQTTGVYCKLTRLSNGSR